MTGAPTQRPEQRGGTGLPKEGSHSGGKAVNPRGLGTESPTEGAICLIVLLQLGSAYDVGVRSLSKALVGLGTALIAFGLLFAQVKSTDHTPDLVIWSSAAMLLLAALFVSWLKQAGPGWLVGIAVELLFCVYVIVDVLQHLHSL